MRNCELEPVIPEFCVNLFDVSKSVDLIGLVFEDVVELIPEGYSDGEKI